MKKSLVKAFLMAMVAFAPTFAMNVSANGSQQVTNNFTSSIDRSTETIQKHLDTAPTDINMKAWWVSWAIRKTIDVVFPVLVVVAVLVAMFGLYTVLSDPAKVKEGMMTITYGMIWIVLLFSANYLSTTIFSGLWGWWATESTTIDMATLLTNIYSMMVYPFLKIAIYFSLGILVIIMMSRVFTYITSQDDKVKTKATGVITWSVVGMLIITGAKQIVEAIYGKQEAVLKGAPTSLTQIGSQILNPKSIPIVFQIMNWALGLISLILLVMIIWQTYQMLTKPDDASTFKTLRSTILCAFIGLVLIGSAYLLANRLIIT